MLTHWGWGSVVGGGPDTPTPWGGGDGKGPWKGLSEVWSPGYPGWGAGLGGGLTACSRETSHRVPEWLAVNDWNVESKTKCNTDVYQTFLWTPPLCQEPSHLPSTRA